jgi:hypothetical protein
MPTKDTTELKQNIIESIKKRGPSLPIHIAKDIEMSMLFTSAFLGELVGERRLKISNLRVGSSPIYYLEGQEEKLEDFGTHLKSKEKVAFELLQKERFLEDETQHPAIRVALREIKDYAIPFEEEGKIIWRYFIEPVKNYKKDQIDEKEIIEEKINEELIKENKEIPKKEVLEAIEEVRVESNKKEEKREKETGSAKEEKQVEDIFEKEKPKEKKKKEYSEFVEKVIDYLEKNNFKIKEELSFKKKEYHAIIEINSDLGPIDFILYAKEKKTLNTDDLMTAVKIAKEKNTQILFLSLGDLNKKSKEFYDPYSNLVRFRKL